MANNNRVEVHIGAKTSELKEGMQDAEKNSFRCFQEN